MNKFKIKEINIVPGRDSSYLSFEVKFESSEKKFGRLGKYIDAVVIPDVKLYEKEFAKLYVEADSSRKAWYTTHFVSKIEAEDVIVEEPDGSFSFKEYVSSNPIVLACIEQLKIMKDIRDGSDEPEAGFLHSGDAFYDFIVILETIYRFWD